MCVCGKDVAAGTRVARRSPSGQLPGFFLGLQCRRERQELSVEILGKDQHIPRWVRKKQYVEGENCSTQEALQGRKSNTWNQTSPMTFVLLL